MSLTEYPAKADALVGKAASVYGYALNDEMFQYKVLSTANTDDVIDNSGTETTVNGIIFADTIKFEKTETSCLVIFRADGDNGCMCADIYGYDTASEKALPITTIAKFYHDPSDGVDGCFAIGYNGDIRYLIYEERSGDTIVSSEYYTVIDNTAFRYVTAPEYAHEKNIVTFNGSIIDPWIDIAPSNGPVEDFFTELKNAAADSVTYEDISEKISQDEELRIEKVLENAAKYNYLNISRCNTMEQYENELANPDANNIFYTITDLYDLGDEIYYARFATDNAFYNYALLRRSAEATDGYQILSVRTDSIPLSDTELKSFKDAYMHNKLLFKKSRGSIEGETSSTDDPDCVPQKHLQIKKLFNMPQLICDRLKLPLSLIGGGVCLAMFVAIWATMTSEDN